MHVTPRRILLFISLVGVVATVLVLGLRNRKPIAAYRLVATLPLSVSGSPNLAWQPRSNDKLAFGNQIYSVSSDERIFTGLGVIKSVAWNNDGSILAGCGDIVWIWTPNMGVEELIEGQEYREYYSVAWSLDGSYFAATGGGINKDDNKIWIWEVKTRDLFMMLEGDNSLLKDNMELIGFSEVAWSPNRHIVATSSFGNNAIRIWDVVAGQPVPHFYNTLSPDSTLAFSPDGNTLAAIDGETIVLWDTDGGQKLKTFGKSQQSFTIAEWSPDGQRLATANSENGRVIVWDIQGQLVYTLEDSQPDTFDIAWNPDGQRIALATGNGTFIWNFSPNEIEFIQSYPSHEVAWSENGDLLAVDSGKAITIFDTSLKAES